MKPRPSLDTLAGLYMAAKANGSPVAMRNLMLAAAKHGYTPRQVETRANKRSDLSTDMRATILRNAG